MLQLLILNDAALRAIGHRSSSGVSGRGRTRCEGEEVHEEVIGGEAPQRYSHTSEAQGLLQHLSTPRILPHTLHNAKYINIHIPS